MRRHCLMSTTSTSKEPKVGTLAEKTIVKEVNAIVESEDALLKAFVNNIMKHGKKATARRIVNDALHYIHSQRPEADPRQLLDEAMEKVEPLIKIVGSKRGSRNIQIPRPMNERQRRRTAILWIIDEANKRHKRNSMGQRIGMEILAVLQGDSAALAKRSQMHKAALQNRSNVVLMDRKIIKS
ncbi:hypothetical protein HDU96_006549 [Phlyctochytrium bullatum]|nr:hypothetical protein HDU96_006549 [Phlyctochytrium bullatum]